MKAKLSNKIIDDRILLKNILRIDNYLGCYEKIAWKCILCNHLWQAVPVYIIQERASCPNCSNKRKLTNELVDKKIQNRKIKRIDNIVNSKVKINFQCLVENCN